MKKTYMTPSTKKITMPVVRLLIGSGLETDKPQETEVDESWSREDSYIFD